MDDDKVDSSMTSIPSVSLFRGVYNRVAKRLGVDPSYVSRVARGERKSAAVEKALADEVRAIREHLNDHERNHNSNHNSNHNGNHNHNSNHNHSGNHNHNQLAPAPAQKKKLKSNSAV
jgi:DNA-binding transcriptional regulator YdaS (Cro superfamily)